MENKGLLIGIAAVAIIGISVVAFSSNKPASNTSTTAEQSGAAGTMETGTGSANGAGMAADQDTSMMASNYKDGTYSATGTYTSPAGQEEVDVTVTLKGDIIEDVAFVGKAVNEKSVAMQGLFSDNYKPLVVGKNIDEVQLDKVSGSSLTPKGFNDSIEQIKMDAAL